jgi:hypothetical protein
MAPNFEKIKKINDYKYKNYIPVNNLIIIHYLRYKMVKVYDIKIFECPCGYHTFDQANAQKHSKTAKCKDKTMTSNVEKFVKVTDHIAAGGNVNTDVDAKNVITNPTAENISINDNTTNNITIQFVLPEKTLKEDMIEYLEAVKLTFTPSAVNMAKFPADLLLRTRGADKLPGAITERGTKIHEKLPDGNERIMGRKKAIRTYTHEAVEALCKRPPTPQTGEFYADERGLTKTKVSLQDAIEASAKDSVTFHHRVPNDVKKIVRIVEGHTETALDQVVADNKLQGF